MEKKNTPRLGKALRQPALLATLVIAAISLSACMVAPDRGDRGGWGRHHHWNNDRHWNGDDDKWSKRPAWHRWHSRHDRRHDWD